MSEFPMQLSHFKTGRIPIKLATESTIILPKKI